MGPVQFAGYAPEHDMGWSIRNYRVCCLLVSACSAVPLLAAQRVQPAGTLVSWGGQYLPYLEPGQRFTAIAAGGETSFALKADGTILAWGNNTSRQCEVPAGLTGVTALSAFGAYALALKSDGTVVAWGAADTGSTDVPPGLSNVVSIAAGGGFSLASKADGTVVAWGTSEGTNLPADLNGVKAVAAGSCHGLALKTNGTVVAWGCNNFGQCIVPPGLEGVTALAAGEGHSLALKTDGTVVAWGDNQNGQCTVPIPSNSNIVAIAAGGRQSRALRSDGTVVCWGAYQQPPPELTNITAIAAGSWHSVALRADGAIIGWGAWGVFDYGQTTTPGAWRDICAVSARWNHNLALRASGEVFTWGQAQSGQEIVPPALKAVAIDSGFYNNIALRTDGTAVAWPNGVPPGLRDLVAIAAGFGHELALRSNGTVVAWGSNVHGETDVPAGLSNVVGIAAGAWHNLALKSDGTVAAWGWNADGPYWTGQATPPPGLRNVIAVAAGRMFSLALKSDGTVVAWGEGASGQTNVPPGLCGVIAISAGSDHALALKSDGTIVAWGANWYGQRTIPADLQGVLTFSAGEAWNLASVAPPGTAPIILALNPGSQTAGLGCHVDFGVAAVGSPPFGYRWWFDGAPVDGGTNSVLQLENVQPSRAGAYTVVVTNAFGAVTSAPAMLTLVPTPPVILTNPVSQTVDEGVTAEFSVVVTGGCQPLRCQWFADGTALAAGTNLVLQLPSVRPVQSGLYWAAITNVFGAVTSSPARLTVTQIAGEPPAIVTPPVSERGYLGGAVDLQVSATGSPLLSYQWFLNGSAVSGATGTDLSLTSLQPSHSGAYTVVVTNLFGCITSPPAMLQVVPGPSYAVLHHFEGPEGAMPSGELVLSGTTLYGAAARGGITNSSGSNWGNGTLFRIEVDGTDFRVIKTFTGGAEGYAPNGAGVVLGNALYGTAAYSVGSESGVVFKINTDGTGYTVLKTFDHTIGGWPYAGLINAGSTLYGTTEVGGPVDYGSIFKINTDGTGFRVLTYFDTFTGANPMARLLLLDNTLFGTLNGCGAVFKINTDGTQFAVLRKLTGIGGCPRMFSPVVISGTTLYGTAFEDNSFGSLFRMDTSGSNFTVLRSFTNSTGAWCGLGGPALAGGKLYAMIRGDLWFEGMGGNNFGNVFMMNRDGSAFTVLKSFSGGEDGGFPGKELVFYGDTLYATAERGGRYRQGVLFALGFPSEIQMQLLTQTAEAGFPLQLSLRADGSLPLKFHWLCNGTAVAVTTNSNYEIPAAQFSHAGTYTVVITNVFGACTSAPAMLSIIPAVPHRTVTGLLLSGPDGQALHLDYSPALAGSSWTSLDTVALTTSPHWYFDISTPPTAQGFYHLWQDTPPAAPVSVDLELVPALTLSGPVGSSLRVDYIPRIGPTNAWSALDTVTLTNSSQFYFDTSAIDQPPRLWRLVPVP